jgi:hypothetical protein
MKKEKAFATMLYNRADKLSGTARQKAIRKADDFLRFIDVQSKRPVRPRSKVIKKKRGGKVDATNLNIKKKYGKAVLERLQSKNSRARSR